MKVKNETKMEVTATSRNKIKIQDALPLASNDIVGVYIALFLSNNFHRVHRKIRSRDPVEVL